MPPLRAALRNGSFMRAMLAYGCSVVSEWALWVGVLVYAFDKGGAATAGFASLALLVPAAFAAPAAGAAADGPRPNRVLATVYAVQTLALAAAATAAWLHAPAAVVIALAAVSITCVTFIRPAFAVVVPGLVTTASELTASNVLTGYCDGASVLFGPLIASLLLAVDGAALVFAACAVLTAAGFVLTVLLVRLDLPPAVQPGHAARHGGSTAQLLYNARLLSEQPGSISLLAVLGGQYVLTGALDLLSVIIAVDVLRLGDDGPGYLSAAFGVGAIIGGLASTLIVGRRRLAPAVVVSMVAVGTSLAVLGGVTNHVTVFVLLPVIGVSRTVLDLSGRVLLQRSAPQSALASVFAILEVLAGIGTAIGSILVQVAVAAISVRAAMVLVAAFFILLAAATAKRLGRVDLRADAPVVAIRLLRMLAVFGSLPGPELEGVARAAVPVELPAGTAVVTEGEPGRHYYAIATGEVDVTMDGAYVRTMRRGQGFGEIALLANVARTATVVAKTDVTLLAIERVAFLTAVTGHDASAATAWAVARAFHPDLPETLDDESAA
ncbi:MAG: transporter [Ilumatobacteraceae bacterium]|nr:transporter [Ilumatobacteraceae bacterium]